MRRFILVALIFVTCSASASIWIRQDISKSYWGDGLKVFSGWDGDYMIFEVNATDETPFRFTGNSACLVLQGLRGPGGVTIDIDPWYCVPFTPADKVSEGCYRKLVVEFYCPWYLVEAFEGWRISCAIYWSDVCYLF